MCHAVQVLQVASVLTHAVAFLGLHCVSRLPQEAPLGLLAIPFAVFMNQFAAKSHTVPAQIKPLKLYAIKWHTALALALFLAYVTAGVRMHGAESLVGAPPT